MEPTRFDCVVMKRRRAEMIYRQTNPMTLEERTEFWEARTGALRRRQEQLRKPKGTVREP